MACINLSLCSKVNKVDFESSEDLLKNITVVFDKNRLKVIKNGFNRSR